MGTIFEELVRRFNEENNEEAGEHWTPRDAVKLMARLILLPIADQIESGTYLLYDGACRTGGMLTVAEETLQQLAQEHGKQVATHFYGQEINSETYAIAKADLLLKGGGEAADNIVGGPEHSTLSNDAFPSREFDFMLSNPPYGKSWESDLERMGGKDGIKDPRFIIDHDGDAEYSLLTRSSDGQMLFLANMLSKMKHGTGQGKGLEQFLRIAILRPPQNEQALIVRFLDHADQRIRRYIRAKKKLIKLLEERKQAIIHRAVTHGLDSDVTLKPSGVEWLGGVHAYWEATRLKAVLSRPMRNGLFKKKEAFGGGVPLVNVADVYRETFQIESSRLDRVQATSDEVRTFHVQSGDLFFVRSSLKLEGTGRCALVVNCAPDTVFECHLVQGRPNRLCVDPRFLILQLNSFALRNYLISKANVVTMATVNQNVLATTPVWLPSMQEQARIVLEVENQCTDIQAALHCAAREIEFIREYRTRLIADVVTGKLDVREAAAQLPNEPTASDPDDEPLTEDGEESDGTDPEDAEAEASA